MTSTERVRSILRACLVTGYYPRRRAVLSALALTLVTSVVLLTLDARLPFPRPSEQILYDPSDWFALFRTGTSGQWRPDPARPARPGLGGFSTVQPPVTTLYYRVKPGDTITGIAQRLGLNPDTISSANRPEGRGVHNVSVGELLRIPSQDGVPVTLAGDFDALCAKWKIAPDDVLAANAVSRADLKQGMALFFPGAQHTGYEFSLSLGVAVRLPLRGAWESSTFGYRADPFTGLRSKHQGVDLAVAYGSPIASATDGVVRNAGWDDILGNYVEVRGQMGYTYIYGHMSRILVKPGMVISQGTILGQVGDTGYATGPHLHFEVRRYGIPQNPALFVPGIR